MGFDSSQITWSFLCDLSRVSVDLVKSVTDIALSSEGKDDVEDDALKK